MTFYELTNNQRRYFGLQPVVEYWDREILSDTVVAYFDQSKVVKILQYEWGYLEYDVDIATLDRATLLPKTKKGKERTLTVPRLLKIKGCGMQFSGSFRGGGIQVYDNRRNIFFIKSFSEDGEIGSYADVDRWIADYIARAQPNYFDWLNKEMSKQRLSIKVKEGDIVAFPISSHEYGFAKILVNVFTEREKGFSSQYQLLWAHPRSLIVVPYAFYASSLDIDIDILLSKPTLRSLCIFDMDVYYGEMPVIGYRPLSEDDMKIPFPDNKVTSITIPYTKTDIENFIKINGAYDNSSSLDETT